MGGLMLLTRAQEAGLTITVDGGRLVLRGPKTADALARTVLANKAAELAALTHPQNRVSQSIRDIHDPRPDISEDSAEWRALLRYAALADDADAAESAYGALHGVRCCGARIRLQPSGVLWIEARDDYLGNWGVDRLRWLAPHRSELIRWLRAIQDAEDEAAQNALRKTIWPVDLPYEDRPVEVG